LWVTNVYGPCGYREGNLVWPKVLTIIECGEEAWCLGGDFNITRWVYERFLVGRSTRGMRQLSKWQIYLVKRGWHCCKIFVEHIFY